MSGPRRRPARRCGPGPWPRSACAISVSSSISRRVASLLPGTTMALTRPPDPRASSKTRNPLVGAPAASVRAGARSTSSIPNRMIGLVRAEALRRFVEGEAREGHLLERSLGDDGAADLDDHRLDEVHHRLLGDEAHLEVELGELGLPVAAQVLVAEAARDLEVAVHAGHHEELLELLGALRQRVDGARLEARRDDEVARALRRGLDEDRRLDLHEAGPVMGLADGLDEPRTQDQPLLERLAADVEVAVLEPQALVDRGVGLVDVERRRLRLRQDLEGAGAKLDRAGRQARILGPGEACRDRSRGGDDELVADATRPPRGPPGPACGRRRPG